MVHRAAGSYTHMCNVYCEVLHLLSSLPHLQQASTSSIISFSWCECALTFLYRLTWLSNVLDAVNIACKENTRMANILWKDECVFWKYAWQMCSTFLFFNMRFIYIGTDLICFYLLMKHETWNTKWFIINYSLFWKQGIM